jgi:nucleotide-binding universal stress UspA family protein
VTVVVGFDGGEGAEDALALGLRLAAASGEPPLVAAVHPEEYPLGLGHVDAEWVAAMREEADRMLERARRIAGERATYRRVASSSAAHGLDDLAEAQAASLLVVGSSRLGPLRRIFVGSTAERLLHGAAVPVAVAPRCYRDDPAEGMSTVGCAFVDTPDGAEALGVAGRLAQRVGARLKVLTVVARRAEFSPIAGPQHEREYVHLARAAYQAAVDRAVATAAAELGGQVEVTGELLDGDVVDALAALDHRDVDLLVCGSRGYGPVRRVLLGGTSSRLVRHAATPIVIVPRHAGGPLVPAESDG